MRVGVYDIDVFGEAKRSPGGGGAERHKEIDEYITQGSLG
jgi:hypothetical protein